MLVYLDASAIVKLVVEEEQSAAIRRFVWTFDEHVTSRVGLVESRRALRRVAAKPDLSEATLRAISPIELDDAIAATAAALAPTALRTVDAIHLATALALYHVDAFVTYDDRLKGAAGAIGLAVASPT
jgi:predicted nucleic acid-binding protein